MMRKGAWLGICVLVALVSVSSVSAWYIVSYWIDGTAQSATVEQNVTRVVRRCQDTTVYLAGPTYSVCAFSTNWGSVADDGRVRLGQTGGYHPVKLSVNKVIMTDTGMTDRLYVATKSGESYTIEYYDSAQGSLRYDFAEQNYTLTGTAHQVTLPGSVESIVFKNSGFSNNGQWLVTVSDRSVLRYDLSTGNVVRFGTDEANDVDAIYTPTIDNSGVSITLAGANYWRITLYDLWYCGINTPSVSLYNAEGCPTRVFTDEQLGGQYPSNPQFREDGLSLRYNVVAAGHVNEMLLWTGTPLSMEPGGVGVDYVALGDSFQSGEGDAGHYLAGTDGTSEYPNEKCHVSTTSYSARLSSQFSGEYFSVACSGAKTEDVLGKLKYRGQFSQLGVDVTDEFRLSWNSDALLNHTQGRIPQINFVTQYHPTVVTLGIGGNDVLFADIVKACIISLTTCDEAGKNRGEIGKKVQGLYSTLINTYGRVLAQSPGTKLYVVGYPLLIAEGSNSCAVNVGFLDGTEKRFINEGTKYLNQIIKAAAYSAGAYYVDVENALGDEALCGKNADAMNGITLGDDMVGIGSFYLVGQESFHPTARGHELIAQAITSQFGSLANYQDPRCSASVNHSCRQGEGANPPMPAYFASALSPSDPAYVAATEITSDDVQSTTSSHTFSLVDALFQSFSTFALSIRSDPQQLGIFTVDANGLASGSYTLPSTLPSGYHTLVVDGVTPDGQTVRYEQVIFVYNPALPSENNVCGGIVPVSGLDQDNDGVDDACDGQIAAENQQLVYSLYDITNYGTVQPQPSTAPTASTVTSITQQSVGSSRYVAISDMPAVASAKQETANPEVVATTENQPKTRLSSVRTPSASTGENSIINGVLQDPFMIVPIVGIIAGTTVWLTVRIFRKNRSN